MDTNIDKVREALMNTISDLRSKETPMDIDRARAIAQVAGVMIDSAKVEVDFMRVTGGLGSGFIKNTERPKQIAAESTPGAGAGPKVTVHKLKG